MGLDPENNPAYYWIRVNSESNDAQFVTWISMQHFMRPYLPPHNLQYLVLMSFLLEIYLPSLHGSIRQSFIHLRRQFMTQFRLMMNPRSRPIVHLFRRWFRPRIKLCFGKCVLILIINKDVEVSALFLDAEIDPGNITCLHPV